MASCIRSSTLLIELGQTTRSGAAVLARCHNKGLGVVSTATLARLLHSSLPSQSHPSTLSYVQGASDIPMMGTTIGKLMERAAEQYGSKDAFVSVQQDVRLSHEELLAQSDRLASAFYRLGLRQGDRVGIWAPNLIEWILVQYATSRAGIILVNVNPAYRVSEMKYAMRKVGIKALVASEQFKTSNYYEMLTEIIPTLQQCDPMNIKHADLPDLRNIIMISEKSMPGALRFDDVMDMGDTESRGYILDLQDKLQFDDPINIQFTSGTTGKPKGAVLSHHNILNNAFFVGNALKYNTTSRICCPVPLYHCFGMVMASLTTLTQGTCMVLPSPSPDPKASLEAIQTEKCTAFYGTPTMFIDALELPNLDSYDTSTLNNGIMAGSPCPIEIMKKVIDKLHMPNVTICYGTTENSPVTFQTAMDDPVEKRVSTVGRIHPHVEAKIVDESGRVIARGEKGELCIRGYNVMRHYWGDPDKTSEAIQEDRWYRTGDLAVMDDEGYVAIAGRSVDMIIRGGENIYPLEVEQFLYTNDKVSDVQVIGVPDKRLGEEVCAWIKLREGQQATEEEIKEFCKDKISHFKIPRYVRFVDEFPMTVTGKIQKFIMRQVTEKELKRD